MNGRNPLEMSDEDFMANAMVPSTSEPEHESDEQETVIEDSQEQAPVNEEEQEQHVEEEGKEEEQPADPSLDTVGQAPSADTPEKPENVEESSSINYEDFYNQMMTPFKANGKMIELRSPEEAVQLMKMGANYTLKMQSITKHRKVLTMLENNGLLDTDKLSYLIDLDKKDPKAIHKLVKEAGVDPLDIDIESEPTYSPGNHAVSDEELAFRSALDDLTSNPGGQETLQIINSSWDQASKDVLWNDPGVMATIHQQRVSGVYDRVVAEVDRQRMLGNIPAELPFLQAYKVIGTHMTQAGAFQDLAQNRQQAPVRNVVAVRSAKPKSSLTNGDKVSAASPTRSTPKQAQQFINPLAMSDEEFLKQMENRV